MPPKKNDEELQALKKAVAQLKKDIAAELGDVEAEVQPLRRVAQDMNVPKMATNLKRRRILKGHFGKIYACQWSDMDSKHLVSAAQDGKLIVRILVFFVLLYSCVLFVFVLYVFGCSTPLLLRCPLYIFLFS
jgi:hypothetical protein